MKMIFSSILLFAGLLASAPAFAQTSVTTHECFNITWYGGAVGAVGKTVKAKLNQAPNIIRYEWKNGTMNFDWLHEGGRSYGITGTWKQDGSNGTFEVRETDGGYAAGYEGWWSSAGNAARNRFIFKRSDC